MQEVSLAPLPPTYWKVRKISWALPVLMGVMGGIGAIFMRRPMGLLLVGMALLITGYERWLFVRVEKRTGVMLDGGKLVVQTGFATMQLPLHNSHIIRGFDRHRPFLWTSIHIQPACFGRWRGALGPVQMLVTDPAHAIEIIPTEGIPVVVSPEDPDAFVAACAAAGAVEE